MGELIELLFKGVVWLVAVSLYAAWHFAVRGGDGRRVCWHAHASPGASDENSVTVGWAAGSMTNGPAAPAAVTLVRPRPIAYRSDDAKRMTATANTG